MGALHGMQVALAQLGLEATRFKRTSACAPELAGSTAREDSFGVKDYFKKHNEEISPNTAETPLSSLIFIFCFFLFSNRSSGTIQGHADETLRTFIGNASR